TIGGVGRLGAADVGEGRDRFPERRDLIPRAAGVVRDDRVGDVYGVHEIPQDAIGGERLRVLREPRGPLGQPLALEVLDLLGDGRETAARSALAAVLYLRPHALERRTR